MTGTAYNLAHIAFDIEDILVVNSFINDTADRRTITAEVEFGIITAFNQELPDTLEE